MDKKGGRISLTINGRAYTARGKVEIMPATVEVTNDVNRNGTGYGMVKPKLAKAEIEFERSNDDNGVFLSDEDLLASFNLTIVEEDAGFIHYFTSARFSGTPSIDTESGAVSGMAAETDRGNYLRTRA